MQSSGGVMTRDYLRGAPVRILASGPAAGVVGGAALGRAKGEPDLLCVDMGGTSYDVAVVRGGEAPAEAGWNWHHRYVVALPMVQVETLGAGGGSICRVRSGELRVGPESAGADPGPVCYGRGGELPTVTDALLVLGILSEEAEFAGGSFRLTRRGVEEAFAKHVAEPLGYGIEDAAYDCFRVVNANMTQAVRRTTAERGIDPRELAMLAYGGNGPAFAGIQAQELGIRRILVPRTSPAFSALGTLVARPAIDEERAYLAPAGSADPRRMRELWGELVARARHFFSEAGLDPGAVEAWFGVQLRYPGQNWSLSVEAGRSAGLDEPPSGAPELVDRVVERFHRAHEAEYGHRREAEEPEITGLRLSAAAPVQSPPVGGGRTAPERPAPVAGRRRANLGEGFGEVPVYRGADLRPGHRIPGPGIVEERFTTVVVYPGWEARVDDAGDYLLERLGS